jgi:DNA-binding CsgD family transcriptional regulator
MLYVQLTRDAHMSNDLDHIVSKKRVLLTIIVLGILVLTLTDMIFDKAEGVGWPHLTVEALVVVFCFSALVSLWWHTLRLSAQQKVSMEKKLDETRADLEKWRTKTQELLDGLGQAIEEQFQDWSLTAAEQEVALLLLKGLSVKEIATIRNTKEKTVRHQAAAVYRKADVEGRNDLAAFFLEDLLLPTRNNERVGRVNQG